jgi:hypothetical protein
MLPELSVESEATSVAAPVQQAVDFRDVQESSKKLIPLVFGHAFLGSLLPMVDHIESVS